MSGRPLAEGAEAPASTAAKRAMLAPNAIGRGRLPNMTVGSAPLRRRIRPIHSTEVPFGLTEPRPPMRQEWEAAARGERSCCLAARSADLPTLRTTLAFTWLSGIFSMHRLGAIVMRPGITLEYRNSPGCFWALSNRDVGRVGLTLLRIDAGVGTGPVYGSFHIRARQAPRKPRSDPGADAPRKSGPAPRLASSGASRRSDPDRDVGQSRRHRLHRCERTRHRREHSQTGHHGPRDRIPLVLSSGPHGSCSWVEIVI
jgi:hypothetical protein